MIRDRVQEASGLGALLLLFAVSGAAGPVSAQGLDEIEARVWLGSGSSPVYERGDRVRLHYRATRDAYVAVFQIDTDGIVRLHHPRVPDEDHYVRGGRDYRLRFFRSPYWYVDDQPGMGYFFIVASHRPLDFSSFRYSHVSGGWDLAQVGRRVYQDPYLAMDDFVAALIPDWRLGEYALDFVEYHVGRTYDYPRFVCYDCHAFRPYRSWNPYRYQCHSFRLIVHTDPWFYPVTRYRGTRVVYARPPAPNRPRFVFKERARGEPAVPIFQPMARTDVPGVAGAERRRSTGGALAPSREGGAAVRGTDGGATRQVPPAPAQDARRRDAAGAGEPSPAAPGRNATPAAPSDRAAPDAAGARRVSPSNRPPAGAETRAAPGAEPRPGPGAEPRGDGGRGRSPAARDGREQVPPRVPSDRARDAGGGRGADPSRPVLERRAPADEPRTSPSDPSRGAEPRARPSDRGNPGPEPRAEPRARPSEPRGPAAEPRSRTSEPRSSASDPRARPSEPRRPAAQPGAQSTEPRSGASRPRSGRAEPRPPRAEPRAPAPRPRTSEPSRPQRSPEPRVRAPTPTRSSARPPASRSEAPPRTSTRDRSSRAPAASSGGSRGGSGSSTPARAQTGGSRPSASPAPNGSRRSPR